MASDITIAHASQTLTFTGQPSDTETVVIGSKTYTFQATLTDSDGNVHIGSDTAGTISNLAAAIALNDDGESATSAGTDYAASMTRHPSVSVESFDATTLVVAAPGEGANEISSTETSTAASWGAATLAGGQGNIGEFIEGVLELNQVNAEVQFELKKLTVADD